MGKRDRFRNYIDPEYQRWGRKYPRFPGVGECVRLIKANKARGAWADIIAGELAENAKSHLPELIDTYRGDANRDVRLYVMMALEMARLPEAVSFLEQVLGERDELFASYAERALRGIDTSESRTALWNAANQRTN